MTIEATREISLPKLQKRLWLGGIAAALLITFMVVALKLSITLRQPFQTGFSHRFAMLCMGVLCVLNFAHWRTARKGLATFGETIGMENLIISTWSVLLLYQGLFMQVKHYRALVSQSATSVELSGVIVIAVIGFTVLFLNRIRLVRAAARSS